MLLPQLISLKHAGINCVNRIRGTYAQFGQDAWLLQNVYTKKYGGYFVEVGAADGIMFSNTFLLEKRYRWQGMCIEGNSIFSEKLKKNRICLCVEACVSDKESEVDFVDNVGLNSGMIEGLHEKYLRNIVRCHDNVGTLEKMNLHTVRKKTTTLRKIFEEYHVPNFIEFMSVDVEGSEFDVLTGFPFDSHTVGCMIVEHFGIPEKKNAIQALLTIKDYRRVKEHKYEDYFLHKSMESIAMQ